MDPKEAEKLRKLYPNHMPLHVASKYLGVSPRQLSKLIADGREPFRFIGANIGTNQRYIRIKRMFIYSKFFYNYMQLLPLLPPSIFDFSNKILHIIY